MNWEIKAFLLLIFISTSSGSECFHADSSIECFISFLRHKNASDAFIISMSQQTSNSMQELAPACLRGVDSEKQKLLSQAHFQMRHKTSYECLQRATEDDQHFLNLLLNLRVVKSLSESSMRKINNFFNRQKTPKEIAVERIESQLRDIISQTEVKCDSSADFGDLFDSFFNSDSDDFERYDDVQEYCMRLEVKAAVAHLNIEVNPKNQTVAIDCEKVIQLLRSEIIDSSKDIDIDSGIKQNCIRSMLKENNDYFHNLLVAELVSSLNLSADQQKRERQTFINNMVEITLKVRDRCW